nr:hypothetical protein Iba_chr12aCG17000 [Ipomoea batatas]GMD68998.1 hypothetical protein Iba_chr12dCG14670 [Ipomoea batatas]GMD71066.1 hypothetical protein Iba_chr12eCG12380 [Ipomoea batatas]
MDAEQRRALAALVGDATGRRQRLACWRATGGRRGGRRVGGSDWTARDADCTGWGSLVGGGRILGI